MSTTKSDLLASAAHSTSLALSRHKLGVHFRSRRTATAAIDKEQSEVYHALEVKYFKLAAEHTAQAATLTLMANALTENSDVENTVQRARHRRNKT